MNYTFRIHTICLNRVNNPMGDTKALQKKTKSVQLSKIN